MVAAKELFRAYQADPRTTLADIREALHRGRTGQPGGVRPNEFSLRDLAAYFITDRTGEPIGLSGVESLYEGTLLLESGTVTTHAFTAITGQILLTAIREGYDLPEFVLSRTVPSIDGRAPSARLVGVSLPLSEGKSLIVPEGQEYPALGMYEDYARTPEVVKRGAIIKITREALYRDETGMILEQARRVGEVIGLQRETALVDYAVGAVSNCVIEKRAGDTSEGTYNLFYSTAGSRYVNQQVNALVDWTDVDDAENLFLGITMPGTGAPPVLTQRYIVVPPQLASTAFRIVTATETRSGTSNVVVAANPLAQRGIQVIVSPLVYTRLVAAGFSSNVAAGTWFYGDLPRAIKYYRDWDLKVEEGRDLLLSFTHDVVVAFKASECGTPVIAEPRLWSRQTPS